MADNETDSATLKARVVELEARLAKQMQPQGTGIGQFYGFLRFFFPSWLLIGMVLVIGGLEFVDFYIGTLSGAVATHKKSVEKEIAEAEAGAATVIIDGKPAAVRQKEAEITNTTEANKRLKAQLDAMLTNANDQTLQDRKIKAEVALKNTKADLQKIDADARAAEDGLRSLEEKAALTKLVATELQAIEANYGAHLIEYDTPDGYARLMMVLCGNKYAALIGCSEDWVAQYANLPKPQPAQTASITTPDMPATNDQPHMRRTKTGANVRPCMSTDSRQCAPQDQIDANDEVNLLEVLPNGWGRVEYTPNGTRIVRQGYMKMSVFVEE